SMTNQRARRAGCVGPRLAHCGSLMTARARAGNGPQRDVSPSCSGHDGLTPGLGDRKVEVRSGSARRTAVAVAQGQCSNDAPSNGNPDSLCPPAIGNPPEQRTRPRQARPAPGLGGAAAPTSVPEMTVPIRSWPPPVRFGLGILVVRRYYVKVVPAPEVPEINSCPEVDRRAISWLTKPPVRGG